MGYMALEKPAIATKSGSNIKIVKDEISGYLIKKNKIFKATIKLQNVIDDMGFRLKMRDTR